MSENLIGKKGVQEWTVTKELLASSMKSGTVNVFATPYMIALMEYAAMTLVQPFLPEGITTVGTAVNIRHLGPTPEGARVRAEAEILEAEDRRFLFRVAVWDEEGLVGEGTHERCTVKKARFEEKAAARKK
ncbi:MAG TPA: thioesterase family protein [Firmicutes bacterium]|nr:thioesterase family protein [Bacillota bacterium]